MKAHRLAHWISSNVITASKVQLATRNTIHSTLPAHFSSKAAPQSLIHALPASSVILPHEELKIKIVRARQERAAKLRSTQSANTGNIIPSHHDLASYLRAHQIKLDACQGDESKTNALNTNYVHLGTRYEYLIQAHLTRALGFSLTQVGGRGDGGVDLIGTWTLPKATDERPRGRPRIFRVYAQAKRFAPHRKLMPSLMREVEGTLISAPDSRLLKEAFADHLARVGYTNSTALSRHNDQLGKDSENLADTVKSADLEDLGVLVTTRPSSEGIKKIMHNSRRCLMYIHLEEFPFQMPQRVEPLSTQIPGQVAAFVPGTKIRQIIWNEAATKAGLSGYDVKIQRGSQITSEELDFGEAMLAYGGELLSP